MHPVYIFTCFSHLQSVSINFYFLVIHKPWNTGRQMHRSTASLSRLIFRNLIFNMSSNSFLWTARIVAPRYSSWCKVILYAIFIYVFCFFPNVKIRVRGKQGSTLLIAFCFTSIAHAINSGAHQEYVKVTLR